MLRRHQARLPMAEAIAIAFVAPLFTLYLAAILRNAPDLHGIWVHDAQGRALLARLETVLPHPPAAPDWAASIAFRYRRRGASGCASVRSITPSSCSADIMARSLAVNFGLCAAFQPFLALVTST